MPKIEEMYDVWVTELEEDEISEDEAVMKVAREIGCGSIDIRPAAGGRANIFTAEKCCVLVVDNLLRQINYAASIASATSPNFSHASSGQRVARVKSTPCAVEMSQMEVDFR
jgi:molybdenum cofactor cytidylyltransferase